MSYAEQYLKLPFDYDALIEAYPNVKLLNKYGTCFTMSCKWAAMLLANPGAMPNQLAGELAKEIETLAVIHSAYIKETAPKRDDESHEAASKRQFDGHRRVFDAFHLQSPTILGNEEDNAPGFTRQFDPNDLADVKAWNDLNVQGGKMWKAVWAWSARQGLPYAALLSDDGHTVGVFRSQQDTFRIWDMNAGEFFVKNETEWIAWAKAFEKYQTKGGKLQEVKLIQVKRK